MNEDKSKIVHVSRSLEPVEQEISPELELKHNRSKEAYPNLNLSAGEYVVEAAKRHPIGLLLPVFTSLLVIGMALALMIYSQDIVDNFEDTLSLELPTAIFTAVAFVLILGSIAGALISYYVFKNNQLFLTNESIIQKIQLSIFSKQEQSVSLANVEDSSYRKENLVEHFFDYGHVRLSTVGDETTYRLSYVSNPKEFTAILDNAVESFKNGRPVRDSQD